MRVLGIIIHRRTNVINLRKPRDNTHLLKCLILFYKCFFFYLIRGASRKWPTVVMPYYNVIIYYVISNDNPLVATAYWFPKNIYARKVIEVYHVWSVDWYTRKVKGFFLLLLITLLV